MRILSRTIMQLCFFATMFANDCCFEIEYPTPYSEVEQSIDNYLGQIEVAIFENQLGHARELMTLACSLMEPDGTPNGRRLRLLFDNAILSTCEKNALDLESFEVFESALEMTGCGFTDESELDRKPTPIYGPKSMTPKECISSVDKTLKSALICAGQLPIDREAIRSLETKLLYIATKSRHCCSTNGYWKTCLQPLVDAWQFMKEFYQIPYEFYQD